MKRHQLDFVASRPAARTRHGPRGFIASLSLVVLDSLGIDTMLTGLLHGENLRRQLNRANSRCQVLMTLIIYALFRGVPDLDVLGLMTWAHLHSLSRIRISREYILELSVSYPGRKYDCLAQAGCP
jgi:hypothetical protein